MPSLRIPPSKQASNIFTDTPGLCSEVRAEGERGVSLMSIHYSHHLCDLTFVTPGGNSRKLHQGEASYKNSDWHKSSVPRSSFAFDYSFK